MTTRAIACVLLASLLAACQGTPPPSRPETAMSTRAERYVEAFERGEDFTPPAEDLMVAGAPDPAALVYFDRVLRGATPEVTEKVVRLLVDLGLQLDSTRTSGTEVIRDGDILETLIGFVAPPRRGIGREAAMEALRKYVRAADLASAGEVFTRALQFAPSDTAFLLVAKAKPPSAGSVVRDLRRTPAWREDESAAIAAAALGDVVLERAFIDRLEQAEATSDAQAVADALERLALVGTTPALVTIAERLRTPLTMRIPGAFEKSMRLVVLEALRYNYPGEPSLYPNNIVTEDDYSAAERFCAQTLGVAYTTPPPPFMTYVGEPIPVP